MRRYILVLGVVLGCDGDTAPSADTGATTADTGQPLNTGSGDADTDTDADADADADSDSDSDADADADSGSVNISFVNDVWPIVSSGCGTCHQTDKFNPGFLMGTAAETYDTWLFDAPDNVVAGLPAYVVPSDAASSILIDKVQNAAPVYGGDQMPHYSSGLPMLSTAAVDLIAAWIDEGALDN